jgi:hypothetical protein
MDQEEILDRPIKKHPEKARFYMLFWIAGTLLVLRFVFYYMHWPYSNVLLLLSGFFYELFSLLRLIYYPNKTLFQTYSYLFFLFVIPGFILDYLHYPWAKYLLFIALIFPVLFFGQVMWDFIKRKMGR